MKLVTSITDSTDLIEVYNILYDHIHMYKREKLCTNYHDTNPHLGPSKEDSEIYEKNWWKGDYI